MPLIGYARVSTEDQNLGPQLNALQGRRLQRGCGEPHAPFRFFRSNAALFRSNTILSRPIRTREVLETIQCLFRCNGYRDSGSVVSSVLAADQRSRVPCSVTDSPNPVTCEVRLIHIHDRVRRARWGYPSREPGQSTLPLAR